MSLRGANRMPPLNLPQEGDFKIYVKALSFGESWVRFRTSK